MASDVEIVLQTLPRIQDACRSRAGAAPTGQPVSEHQARILRLLDPDDPAMVGELAEAMGVTPSTMSLNLTRLERIGLVVRERDPADRRVMNVRLSPAGAEVRDATAELDVGRVDALLRRLDREERRLALRTLVALAEAADALSAGAAPRAAPGDAWDEGAGEP